MMAGGLNCVLGVGEATVVRRQSRFPGWLRTQIRLAGIVRTAGRKIVCARAQVGSSILCISLPNALILIFALELMQLSNNNMIGSQLPA